MNVHVFDKVELQGIVKISIDQYQAVEPVELNDGNCMISEEVQIRFNTELNAFYAANMPSLVANSTLETYNPSWRKVTSHEPSVDAFQTAVFANGGNLTTAERNALETYVRDAKTNANAWWDDTVADWPFVGSSLAAHAINLKDPENFNLTFGNTVAGDHTANGWKPNGVDSYADTGIIPDTHLSDNELTMEYYSRTESQEDKQAMGCQTAPGHINFMLYRTNGLCQSDIYNGGGGGRITAAVTSSLGGYTVSRRSVTDIELCRNGASLQTGIGGDGGRPVNNLQIGCTLNYSTRSSFCTWETAGNLVGNGFTSAQMLAQYNARQTLNTSLSRQVG